MHPNSLKNLKPYPPGVSGYANRGSKLPPELRGIASLTQTEVTKIISKYARMTKKELEETTEIEDKPALEVAICQIFLKSIKFGDFTRLSFLLDRCIGKVKEIEPDENDREELQKLSLNELLALVKDNLPEVG